MIHPRSCKFALTGKQAVFEGFVMKVYLFLHKVGEGIADLVMDITHWPVVPRAGEVIWITDMPDEAKVEQVTYDPNGNVILVELEKPGVSVTEDWLMELGWQRYCDT